MNNLKMIVSTILLLVNASILYPVTYIVTTTNDSGVGSLRDAINQVNTSAFDTINFNIPSSDPHYDPQTNTWIIQPQTDLPIIAQQVVIDGYSQPGSNPNTLLIGDNATLNIVIDGINVASNGYTTGNGLHFGAGSDNSIIRGLVLYNWFLNGLLLDGANGTIDNIQILGNFIGVNAAGDTSIPTRTGIGISGATNKVTNTLIGTVNPEDRNILSGSFGFLIFDSFVIRGACICSCYNSGTSIINNYIGTDRSGIRALGLSQAGIMFISENHSNVGSSELQEGQHNLISGQTIYGINLTNTLPNLAPSAGPGCTECIIARNFIGTDITGTNALGNKNAGIAIDSFSTDNLIIENLVSGNGTGIRVGQFAMPGSTNNTLLNNSIGTNFTQEKQNANSNFGIIVNDNSNIIGTPLNGNTIAGNFKGGILLYGAQTNIVSGNYIGTTASSYEISIPNEGPGIRLGSPGSIFCSAAQNSIIN